MGWQSIVRNSPNTFIYFLCICHSLNLCLQNQKWTKNRFMNTLNIYRAFHSKGPRVKYTQHYWDAAMSYLESSSKAIFSMYQIFSMYHSKRRKWHFVGKKKPNYRKIPVLQVLSELFVYSRQEHQTLSCHTKVQLIFQRTMKGWDSPTKIVPHNVTWKHRDWFLCCKMLPNQNGSKKKV